ncbi:RiPP maturation radical SAM C-methyltransferase [Methylorubrum extorquens]
MTASIIEAAAGVQAGARVALVCMPFYSARQPSIQIGLLTAIAERAGFDTAAYHFNLDLARELGPPTYERLCEHRGHLVGDWLFGPASFGAECSEEARYFDAFPTLAHWLREIGKDEAYLAELRRVVLPRFVESCLAVCDWSQFGVVGFTSTFQQNVASLALARRIKERHPQTVLVFGGANMEGEMGLEFARAFRFVDYVVSGEGDTVFPALLTRLLAKQPACDLAGVIANRDSDDSMDTPPSQAAPIRDLDSLPVPNYAPYFERAEALGLLDEYVGIWTLPFESSRGCWWGQKHHCTFCGLNGLGMAYRAKTPDRVLAELGELTRRHHISAFTAVDNILDHKYISDLFERIAGSRNDPLFFYEVKANLTRPQLQALYRGGVRRVQPGIESLSTPVLRLMRKGSTMLQNVRLLKWCRYYDIAVDWNLIWGFPGETVADYESQFDVLKSIMHLEPPISSGRIWLERFSPYYKDRDKFPIRNVRAEASYRFVYPPHVDVDRLAYFFDYEMADTVPTATHEATTDLIRQWRDSWGSANRSNLSYRRVGDCLLIDYNRGGRRGTYGLSGTPALVYEACGETMQSADQVAAQLQNATGGGYAVEEVREALDEFCRAKLMLGENGLYLSLAIPSNPNW